MVRIYALLLCTAVLAQLSQVQCPTAGSNGSAPDAPFVPAPRQIDAFAEASDETPAPNEEVLLQGDSEEPGNLAFAWAQTAGPGVVIENADRPTASFVAPSLADDTRFEFLVTIRNDRGDRGRFAVEVIVPADPDFDPNSDQNRRPNRNANSSAGGGARGPVALAGEDTGVTENTVVTLNGSQSTGNSLQYRWSQSDGPEVELSDAGTARPTFTAPAFDPAGTNALEFELSVRDAQERIDTDRVSIRVRAVGDANPQVRMVTSLGEITIELFPEDAPDTVANFLQYVDDDFYNNTIFHRVIPGFVVQGGGFLSGLILRPPRDTIALEANLLNERGTIAMARQNAPDTATSQFYFNLVDNTDLDPGAGGDGYAVFGRVLSGLSIIDRIATVTTESRDGFDDVPVQDVLVRSVERVEN